MKPPNPEVSPTPSGADQTPRLGLYGGSFDPLHHGHLLVAQAALEELRLDRLFFIPAARSPFKPGSRPAPDAARLRMLRRSLAGRSRTEVHTDELTRGGVSYSIDTVRGFEARHPGAELFWLIGADHVPTLPQWREAEALARSVTFVVIPRPGQPQATLPEPWRLRHLRGWPLGVSSSEIRERVKHGLPVDHLVPAGAADVIASEQLYRVASERL
ncbi:MAG: putative nicotinate-nucleotide adenylyltransferase [Verrucomicrobiota bacterium]|jgi:nicotinate-nucleotide adenylyltransferase